MLKSSQFRNFKFSAVRFPRKQLRVIKNETVEPVTELNKRTIPYFGKVAFLRKFMRIAENPYVVTTTEKQAKFLRKYFDRHGRGASAVENASEKISHEQPLLPNHEVLYLNKPLTQAPSIKSFYCHENIAWSDVFVPRLEDADTLSVEHEYSITFTKSRNHDDVVELPLPKPAHKSTGKKFKFYHSSPNVLQRRVFSISPNHYKNLLITAPTGTGKTLAFGEQINKLNMESKYPLKTPFCLVLTASAVLSEQIGKQLAKVYGFKVFIHSTRIHKAKEMHNLRDYDVIVSTPSLFSKFAKYWYTQIKSVKMVCLDEADHILNKKLVFMDGPYGEQVRTFGRGDFGNVKYAIDKITGCEKTVFGRFYI